MEFGYLTQQIKQAKMKTISKGQFLTPDRYLFQVGQIDKYPVTVEVLDRDETHATIKKSCEPTSKRVEINIDPILGEFVFASMGFTMGPKYTPNA